MSGIIAVATTSTLILAAGTPKTLVQLYAPTNQKVRILGWGVYFDGISATAKPVYVRVLKQLSAGTMSGAGGVVATIETVTESLRTTATFNATAEPSSGAVVDSVLVHPQQGYEIRFPFDQGILLSGNERIGIEVTAAAGVNAVGKFVFEE